MPDRTACPQWRTSSRSAGGNCVQVATQQSHILVRDSKDPDGGVLTFDRSTFQAFLAGVQAGEFDRPA
jgi:hypothetical protein